MISGEESRRSIDRSISTRSSVSRVSEVCDIFVIVAPSCEIRLVCC